MRPTLTRVHEWTLVPLHIRSLYYTLNEALFVWMNERVGARGIDWDLKFTEHGNICSGVAMFKNPEHATLFALKWLACEMVGLA